MLTKVFVNWMPSCNSSYFCRLRKDLDKNVCLCFNSKTNFQNIGHVLFLYIFQEVLFYQKCIITNLYLKYVSTTTTWNNFGRISNNTQYSRMDEELHSARFILKSCYEYEPTIINMAQAAGNLLQPKMFRNSFTGFINFFNNFILVAVAVLFVGYPLCWQMIMMLLSVLTKKITTMTIMIMLLLMMTVFMLKYNDVTGKHTNIFIADKIRCCIVQMRQQRITTTSTMTKLFKIFLYIFSLLFLLFSFILFSSFTAYQTRQKLNPLELTY